MSDDDPILSDEETGALRDEYMDLIFFGGPDGPARMEEINRILTMSAQARHQEAGHQAWQATAWALRKLRHEARRDAD